VHLTHPSGEDISENGNNICKSQIRDCLSDRCVAVVVSNFERYPVHENIPAGCMREITSRLVGDLDLKIASEFIFDESYWKQRCYQLLPKNYQINEHGLTWKQLFFETHLQQVRQFLTRHHNYLPCQSAWKSLVLMNWRCTWPTK